MNEAAAVSAIEPLDAGRVRAGLPQWTRLGGLRVHAEVDSTNSWLQERAHSLPSPYACLSEHQHAGRGRRGRTWLDGTGRDLCLSVFRRFDTGEPRAQGLSLAIGVAAVRALEAAGAHGLGLKWPNDVVWRDRKLGGILIEGAVAGRVWAAVIGIGVNVHAEEAPEGGPPRVHLDAIPGARASRNRLAARLIAEVCAECDRFEARGGGPAIAEWKALDAMRGRPVDVVSPRGRVGGVARGVDEAGELLVEVNGGIERFVSAEVSLRTARPEGAP